MRRARGILFVLATLAAACWIAACGERRDAAEGARGGSARVEKPPVVLVSIDTLRADRLPIYGHAAGDTPAIDALAADGHVVERAYAHVPLTLPSHMSIFTGLLPPRHGVRHNAGYAPAADLPVVLPRTLAAAGWRTIGAVSAFPLSRAAGFGEGFEHYDDANGFAAEVQAKGRLERPGDATLDALLVQLGLDGEAAADGPPFLFLHLFEPHRPYRPPTGLARDLADDAPIAARYDAEITVADAVVGRLIAALKELNLYDDALIVLLSDHGEGLGDHGETEHGMFLYPEALHVPLLIKPPGGRKGSARIEGVVRLVDVAPTILELAGVEVPEGLDGESLVPALASGLVVDRSHYAETFFPRLEMGWSESYAAIRGDHQFIEAPTPELYDLTGDPGAELNLLADDVDELRRTLGTLRADLREVGIAWEEPGQVDAETRGALASLGYAGSGSEAGGGLADAKDHIATYEAFKDGLEASLDGDWPTVVERMGVAVDARPDLLDAWVQLARGLRETGDLGAAVEAYTHAADLSDDPVGLSGEALEVLRHLGDGPAAARFVVERRRAQPGVFALRRLEVELLLALGRVGEAARAASQALDAADPASEAERADAHHLVGTTAATEGRLGDAASHFEQAVALDPRHVRALGDLAVLRAQSGDLAAAGELLRRVLELRPDDARARENLGRLEEMMAGR